MQLQRYRRSGLMDYDKEQYELFDTYERAKRIRLIFGLAVAAAIGLLIYFW